MCTMFGNNFYVAYVRRWVKLIPPKSPKIGSWEKTFLSLDLRVSKNILQIGQTRVSKFKFMHILSQSKGILQLNKRLLFHAL